MFSGTKKKKSVGAPKKYEGEMIKRNLRLPEYLWAWLDGLSTNRTQALILLHKKFSKGGRV